MTYVALLRGVNVGGNRKVDMKQLKATFERAGMHEVRTYINSGNVIFRSGAADQRQLVVHLEGAIKSASGFPVKVIVRDAKRVRELTDALPETWVNGAESKCDVMFLSDEVDGPEVLALLPVRPEIDEVTYVAGAILWRVSRSAATRSGMLRLVGTELYANMTIRNCNTVRKVDALMR